MNERESRSLNSSQKISHAHGYSECYLEGSKGELSKKFHKAQHPSGMLVSNKGKDDLMGPQQWDQSQRRLSQPKITKKEKNTMPLSRSFLIPMITGSHWFCILLLTHCQLR